MRHKHTSNNRVERGFEGPIVILTSSETICNLTQFSLRFVTVQGWGCGSMVECHPATQEALGLIPSITNK